MTTNSSNPPTPPQPAGSSPASWGTPPTPGEVITSLDTGNSYTMGVKIGEGNFGMVYECVDFWGNLLAAKVMKPSAPYEKVKASTEAELGKLRLLRHPHITYVFDAFEFRETFYIITERCVGPLNELIGYAGFEGKGWLKPIARCLLQAVHYIHIHNYAHQDIHLGNVFTSVAKNEMNDQDSNAIQFKLGDLGVAKVFSELDANNTRALWMLPPEVHDPAEFGRVDHRIDIYHCGLLFLHILNGAELRFTTEEILRGKPREFALQLPPPYNFALEKALRRHVAFRTENAMELWRDLSSPEQTTQDTQPKQIPLEGLGSE